MRNKRPSLICTAILLALLAGCSGTPLTVQPVQARLSVFAAASLAEVLTEIGQAFQAENPGVEVVFNFAGSQQLAQQLAQGAPADVLATADETQMLAVIGAGRATAISQRSFTGNRLVVIYPGDNPAGLETLADLARPGVRVALADPSVPAGHYSQAFLDAAAQDASLGVVFSQGVRQNTVTYEENVRAVLSKVLLGEADAGIVYNSDAASVSAGKLGRLDIPHDLNQTAAYYVAPISDSRQPKIADAFVKYLLSPAGQEILLRYGFLPRP